MRARDNKNHSDFDFPAKYGSDMDSNEHHILVVIESRVIHGKCIRAFYAFSHNLSIILMHCA